MTNMEKVLIAVGAGIRESLARWNIGIDEFMARIAANAALEKIQFGQEIVRIDRDDTGPYVIIRMCVSGREIKAYTGDMIWTGGWKL